MQAQPYDRHPDLTDATLALAALCATVRGSAFGADASPAGRDGTSAGNPTQLSVGVILDGTDDTIDFGDVGNVQQVSMWVMPSTITEQLFLADGGNYVHLVAGTLTYAGLTPVATYVNGAVGTAVVAGEWSMIVCQFAQIDADNFELGVDGAGNFGAIRVKDLQARDGLWSASRVAYEYARCVPDDDLRLHLLGGDRDLSRYARAMTLGGGVVVGHAMHFDGTDDYIDVGDVGDVQQVSFWVDPESTTEELFQIDAGKHVTVVAGTITYTGLTEVATYVNAVATTALAADLWQHVVVQFEQDDADNFELGREGANYGEIDLRDVKVRDAVWSLAEITTEYERTCKYY